MAVTGQPIAADFMLILIITTTITTIVPDKH